MKKPFLFQYFFAKDWPWIFMFGVMPVIIACLLLFGMIGNVAGFMGHAKAIFAAASSGFVLCYIPAFILGQILMKINGSPYSEGDKVHILSGEHKGKIAEVYEIWKERKQVRLDLGEQAKQDVEDAFSYMDVCRAT